MNGPIGALTGYLAEAWARIRDAVIDPRPDSRLAAEIAAKARAEAPVVWLLGKVGSGKSSIVRAMTGSSEAEIGSGFRPCTRASRVFDFPADAPVVRFLDTRGLGEVAYDPAEDIAFCEGQAQLVLATARVLDPVQQAIFDAVRRIRGRHPEWPLVVAQTSLHDAYPPGAGHVLPYPFGDGGGSGADRVPEDLARALAAQRRQFAAIPGTGPVAFVAIDVTLPGDGFEPEDYGLDALWDAIGRAAPLGLEAMLRERGRGGDDAFARRAHPHIMGHAAAAAAIELIPAVGLVAVPGIQGKMLHSLAGIHGIAWDKRTLAEFGGCLGGGFATRYAVELLLRQAGKLIPWWGWTVGAASAAAISFATTYALGKAACFYLAARRRDARVDAEAVARAYAEALAAAIEIARRRRWGGDREGGKG